MMEEITPASVLQNLETRFVGRSILCYRSLPSTMEVAKQAAREGAPEGTVILALEQTAGKGRLGRPWLSPPGSLALSILLYPRVEDLPGLNMMAGLAVVHTIEKVAHLRPSIKWPNDVLIADKKVCGILIDSELKGKDVAFAAVGIGLNVNLDPALFPEIAPLATSLAAERGQRVSCLEVLVSLLEEVERLYLALRRGEPLHEEWRRRLETLGKRVKVKSGASVQEGVAEDVDSEGCLLLRKSDGTLARIAVGEVTLQA